jgi:hypothetical protein
VTCGREMSMMYLVIASVDLDGPHGVQDRFGAERDSSSWLWGSSGHASGF